MSGTVLGSKKYHYETQELVREAMTKALKEHVSTSVVHGENAILVCLPSEPQTSEAAKALRDNCIRVDEYQEIRANSGSSATFEGALSAVTPMEKGWVTIEKDLGRGLVKNHA